MVVDARVAVCIQRIGDINIASGTANNVGTSSSFKEIIAHDNPGLHLFWTSGYLDLVQRLEFGVDLVLSCIVTGQHSYGVKRSGLGLNAI